MGIRAQKVMCEAAIRFLRETVMGETPRMHLHKPDMLVLPSESDIAKHGLAQDGVVTGVIKPDMTEFEGQTDPFQRLDQDLADIFSEARERAYEYATDLQEALHQFFDAVQDQDHTLAFVYLERAGVIMKGGLSFFSQQLPENANPDLRALYMEQAEAVFASVVMDTLESQYAHYRATTSDSPADQMKTVQLARAQFEMMFSPAPAKERAS